MAIASVVGAGKSVIWYDDLPIVRDRKLMLFGCSLVLRLSKIFALCRNLGWHRSHSFIVTSGTTKRRTGVGYSRLYRFSLVDNPTPTLPLFPNSMRLIVVARSSHMRATVNRQIVSKTC
jgi:hypothetical protein